ncbi:MAG: CHAD domain-containing protein, partial [Rhodospirillales bacterium]|nr:CHAD domain-containing protein [Rhodospirillales bacterium]
MHFELSLSPEAAAALPRLPLVARSRAETAPAQTLPVAGGRHAAEPARPGEGEDAGTRDTPAAGIVPADLGAARPRTGRARLVRRRIVWHDSPDRRLAAAGLALAEERGVWRLERLVPAAESWPPGAPAPILGEGADPARLACADGSPLPTPLAPIAAFEGQVTEHVLATEDGPVVVHRLRGLLRAVAAERAVARVTLTGPDDAIRHAARTLVDALDAEVPRATLAGEALSVATAQPPPPRRLGAPDLPGELSVAAAFGHVVGHLTDVILHHAPVAADPRSLPDAVHQARVAVRRLRSAIAVFRPAIGCDAVTEADRHLRMLARALGPARDWDVFMTETAPAIAG